MSALAPRAPIRRTLRVLKPLAWTIVVLAVIALIGGVLVAIWTNVLWFDSVHYSDDYKRRLLTQIVMFVLFGGVTAAVLTATTWAAAHLPPTPSSIDTPSRIRARWQALSPRLRTFLLALVPIIGGLRAGFAAASQWQLWLQWRNATPFGVTDPEFHRDDGYFVFVYPLHRYVELSAISILTIALISVAVIAWLRGAIQLRGTSPRFGLELRRLVAVLLGLLALVKAAGYWLDRYATVTSSRGFTTGQSYVDLHVVLPAKLVLFGLSFVLAAVFFLAAYSRRIGLILGGVGVTIGAGVLAGGIIPGLIQTFKAKPAAITYESTSIARNIAATRFGFGLQSVSNEPAGAGKIGPLTTVGSAVQPRLLDPNVVSPTFALKQQNQSYYGFKRTLDIDRYDIHGQQTDEVVGVRELHLSGVQSKTWTNTHLVYTHGIGIVAAPTSSPAGNGLPAFNESDIPSHGALSSGPLDRDQIYFGQSSPPYSIVGAPAGKGIEFDPTTGTTHYSYQGRGGVPIGSTWRQLLYALRFRDLNILFSSDVNPDSQLLYLRNPASRIQAVAPWLSLDGDVYPVVAGGHITWVADGYTTSSNLPDSQEENFRSAAQTTYNKLGSSAQQSSTSINYIRNSIVATVDAYTGAVTLYQKPGALPDPVLQTWMKAFPGVVKSANDIPADLLPHLRYPQDLFNVQRSVLATYHVTDPHAFYQHSDAWHVPNDPTVTNNVAQPSYYATTKSESGQPEFTLSSPMLTLNSKQIAAYLSVDCDEGTSDYGVLHVAVIPAKQQTESPVQVQNDIESDPRITHQLTLLRGGQSAVKIGNLQTVDLGGAILNIEPIYTQRISGNPFPTLQRVVVVYNGGPPGYADTFPLALAQALGVSPNQVSIRVLTERAAGVLRRLESDQAAGNLAAAKADAQRLSELLVKIQAAGG